MCLQLLLALLLLALLLPPLLALLLLTLLLGVISIIYDQSGNGNHLLPATPAVSNPQHYDMPVNASRHPITLGGGRKGYGAWFDQGNGYRAQNTSKVALNNEPETIYMVTSGTHMNGGCCFDCERTAAANGDAPPPPPRWTACAACAATDESFSPRADGNSENNCINRSTYTDGAMETVYVGTHS